MALEDRVEVLEQEIRILKNEIQSTLLDIQEQILVHYYPSLRAEESSPPEDVLHSWESLHSRNGDEATEEASSPPGVKKAPFEEIMEVLKGIPSSSRRQPSSRSEEEEETHLSLGGQPSSRSEEDMDWATWTELIQWVSDSVERIGGERTGKLIERYAKGGYLSPEVRDLLLQLISLSNEENPPEKVGVSDMLGILLELNKALGLKRKSDIAMVLSFIEEEDLG